MLFTPMITLELSIIVLNCSVTIHITHHVISLDLTGLLKALVNNFLLHYTQS